jgi:hypothetical protein
MFKGLSYFEKVMPNMVKSKTVVHSGNFNQTRLLGNVQGWNLLSDLE